MSSTIAQQNFQEDRKIQTPGGTVVRPAGKITSPTDIFSLGNIARMQGLKPGTYTGAEVLGLPKEVTKAIDPTNVPEQDVGALTRRLADFTNIGVGSSPRNVQDLVTTQPTTQQKIAK